MEARERAAGDRDEDERNDGTAHDRAAAVDEVREGRHLEVRHHEGDANGEGADRADLEEGGEVVARQQQEPHGKNGGEEAVDRDEDAHRLAVDVEPAEVFGMGGDPRTGKDAEEEEHDADDRRADHVALAPDLHVEAHQNGDGNRRGDRVGRPERVVHGVDHGDREARERQGLAHAPGEVRLGEVCGACKKRHVEDERPPEGCQEDEAPFGERLC